VALIELDLYAPAEPERAAAGHAPLGRGRYVRVATLLILLLALVAAEPSRSVLWRHVGLAPITAPDGTYQLVDGRLFTFDWSADRVVTTAWTLEPLRRLWSHTAAATSDNDGMTPSFGWAVDTAAGDNVVLQSFARSTVVDARTGTVRWSSPGPLTPVAGGRVGLRYDQEFRPGTEYDQSVGAVGPLYASTSGVFHTEPPARTTLHALDMRTGRQLWQTAFSGAVIATDGRTGPGVIVVVAADRLSVLAAGTGAVVRERRLPGPPPVDVTFGDADDRVVLLRHNARQGGTVTAYSMDTLEPLWRRSATPEGSPSFCAGMLCANDGGGVDVLDPATGLPRWRTATGALFGRDRAMIELADRENRPLAVRDPATGAVQVDLDGWTWIAYGRDDTPLLLGRLDGPATLFGVLPPGRRAIQPLGYSPTPVANCESDARYVACRLLGGVELWAYLS
jgi:outer membrane protein assembly factor BamB